MPISKSGKKVSAPLVVVICVLFLTATVLSFSFNGLLRNYFIFAEFIIFMGSFLVHVINQKITCAHCTDSCTGVVDCVYMGTNHFDLDISHMWGYSAVRCYETVVPDIGDTVSVHYNPSDPSVAMLSMYKTHTPTWSKTTPKMFKSGLRAIVIFGLIFCLIGGALMFVVTSKQGEYSIPATGTVVDIVPTFNVRSHSYEYTAVFEYTLDGETLTSHDIAIHLTPPYALGTELPIRIMPGNTNAVLVEGDNSTFNGGCAMFLVGVGIISIAVFRKFAKRRSYILENEEVNYMEAYNDKV